MAKEKTKMMLETMETPVYGNYDVIVVGGGTAGVVAALSAARNGAFCSGNRKTHVPWWFAAGRSYLLYGIFQRLQALSE